MSVTKKLNNTNLFHIVGGYEAKIGAFQKCILRQNMELEEKQNSIIFGGP